MSRRLPCRTATRPVLRGALLVPTKRAQAVDPKADLVIDRLGHIIDVGLDRISEIRVVCRANGVRGTVDRPPQEVVESIDGPIVRGGPLGNRSSGGRLDHRYDGAVQHSDVHDSNVLFATEALPTEAI